MLKKLTVKEVGDFSERRANLIPKFCEWKCMRLCWPQGDPYATAAVYAAIAMP